MDVDNAVYKYTDENGKKHKVPKLRVSSLDKIQRGDHICFYRILYWHHAIVEYIDKSNGEIHVIEYNSSSSWIAMVVRGRYNLQKSTVYLIKHKKCLDPNNVVLRAQSRLGEADYQLVAKKSERFALWCRFIVMAVDYRINYQSLFGIMSPLSSNKNRRAYVDYGVYKYTDKYSNKYEVPRVRVSSLDQIQKGDHICFNRRVYWHHAIVEYIDKSNGEINVIEFSKTAKEFNQDNRSPPKTLISPIVVREHYNLEKDTVYVIKHKKCFDPDSVVSRAIDGLGRDDYNLITNNCEHFALPCKTGISYSQQVHDLKKIAICTPSHQMRYI